MLRQDVASCLHQALRAAMDLVAAGNDVAAVAVAGSDLFIGHGYWAAPAEFENHVAQAALEHQNFGALVVPLLYLSEGEGGSFRDPREEPKPGESHMLWSVTWHEREGFDIHRMFYARRPDGTPVFETVQSFDGAVQLPATTPGAILVRSAIQPGGSS